MPRFDFALSFAGDERALARDLAHHLTRAGVRVFFDETFEHEMLGLDGADYLNRVFFEQSRYCIALISENYEGRAWAQLERRAAMAREHVSGLGFLLPVLVDATRPKWLLPTRIYFDLAERSIPDLVEVLLRKHASEDQRSFHEVQRLELNPHDRRLYVAPGWESDDFLIWSRDADKGTRQVVRLVSDSKAHWTTEDLPITTPAQWLLCGEQETLIAVPDTDDDIVVFSRKDYQARRLPQERRYKWKSVTDAKMRDGTVLIAYCGGDVWHLRPGLLQLRELRPGTDEVQYTYVDFWKENFVVALEELHDLEVRRLADGSLVAELHSPVAAEGLSCFPEADLIAVTGIDSVATIRFSSGQVIATEEVLGQGTYSHSISTVTSLLGFISGLPLPGNTLEVLDVSGARKVVRLRATGGRGWASVSISSSGRKLAVTTGNSVILYAQKD